MPDQGKATRGGQQSRGKEPAATAPQDPRAVVFDRLERIFKEQLRTAASDRMPFPARILAVRKERGDVTRSNVLDFTRDLVSDEFNGAGDTMRFIIALGIAKPKKAVVVLDLYVHAMALVDSEEGGMYRDMLKAAWLTCKLGPGYSERAIHWVPDGNFQRPEAPEESLMRLLQGLAQCPPHEEVVALRKALLADYRRIVTATAEYKALEELAQAVSVRDALRDNDGVPEYFDEAALRILAGVAVVNQRLRPYVDRVVELGILLPEEVPGYALTVR